ncbi:MAG TPA: neutral/alkaline non-lysosomal ceramidase N-terminal domain-containing protein [Planctomycetaceae bacterium]|nr:neutral/alkaline non-lysosomal ceramidase N-terminal domain-containing protein [Planctomycetaceae bacterium]
MRAPACAVLFFSALVCMANECSAIEPLKGLVAGAYAQDITPPRFPISVNGNMADHLAKAAHDPLHARCLVLISGEVQVALVTCDSCMIPREIMDSARRRAAYRTGIPAANILISATHAHSCPTSAGVFQSDPDAEYVEFLADRIVDGIVQAWNQREPAQIGWAVAVEPGQLFNRRWQLKDGVLGENPFGKKVDRVRMNPGYQNPDVERPAGPIDPQISLFSVQSRKGRPIALWANYSLHYVGGVPGDFVSADYFGEFATRVTRRLEVQDVKPAFVAAMTNGTSGDVNNVNFGKPAPGRREPYEQIGVVAENIAERAAEAVKTIRYASDVVLNSVDTEIDLGVRRPSDTELAEARAQLEGKSAPLKGAPDIYARESVLLAAYPPTVKVRIQAIRIGDLAIVSSPCETFTETGLAIKSGSPFKQTFSISLANGYNGYLPPPEHHQWGGYETWRARSSYLAEDAEPRIRETQLMLLKTLDK